MRKSTPYWVVRLLLVPSLAGWPSHPVEGQADIRVASLPAPSVEWLPQAVITDLTNAPNPFDTRKSGLEGQTQISYQLSADFPVQVTVYDLFGYRVRSWNFSAGQVGGHSGSNHFLWDGTNESGQKVAKGGYIAQLEIETGQSVVTAYRKIAVIH